MDKQEVMPSESSFNDEDILLDTMTSLKHLSTLYGSLISEASNKHLLKDIEPLSKDTSKLARDCYNLMFEYGWYSPKEEDKVTISENYTKFKEKEELFN